ncbi:LuxR C-terminal-related transcriptional regulator [Rhodococcus tukisamuensis]|uniref:LuxR family transcriptional regulator, maltose regulon positive regulatory protein n=1 Tax=Rhodococcus tukisamuensis TaxID=168276 RepID=A0A1G6VT27_9NOCA|nr:LuxR C-terminal-related transcriptional regulator [Rhodococcus tukisamuensis]SDD56840.1 LuxR family transcriptional regulator, maltose regulon positive regulatory protein [Rhodococcus tukisamuensis]
MYERPARTEPRNPRQPDRQRRAPAVAPRPRLLARLDRDSPVTVLRAPRGFGKSDLVATWLQSGRAAARLVVWVPAPAGRVCADAYWRTVLERVHAAGCGTPDRRPESPSEVVRESLAHTETSVVLVLNRIDLVDADRFEAEVRRLVDRCPHVNVVATLCGHTHFVDPAAMEPTYELISARDLLYTVEETAEFFDFAAATSAPGETAYVHDRVGGLPDLVRIAALVLKAVPSTPARGRLLANALDRAIADYTRTRVLDNPEITAHRDFAVAVATARVITPEIAAGLGADAGQVEAAETRRRLVDLEAAGVLIRSDATVDEAWEFAPAVRDALLVAQERAGLRPADRLSRLARHHLDRDDPASGLRYAADAADWALVIEILDEHWVDLIGDHIVMIRSTLRDIPPDLLDAYPSIRAGRELFTLLGTQTTSTASTLPIDVDALRRLGAEPNAGELLDVGSVQSLMLRVGGRFRESADMARQLHVLSSAALDARPEEVRRQLPVMRLQWGISHQLAGEFAESTVDLRLAHRGALAQGIDFVARNAAGSSALNWALLGDPQRADEWLAIEASHPRSAGWLELLVKVPALVARALTALDRLDLDTARRALDELGEASDNEELWAFVTYAHSRYALATRRPFDGLSLLRRAVTAHPTTFGPSSVALPLLTAVEVSLRLALGEGNQALALASGAGPEQPWTLVAAARAHLLAGEPGQALALCHRCDWFGHPHPHAHLEALVVEAAAHHVLGNADAAADAWAHARGEADRTGLVWPLATIPRKLVDTLEATATTASTAVAVLRGSTVGNPYPESVHLVQLTEREKLVLAELALGLSTREIASKLFVSANTVKSQQRSLYQKLGGHSREEILRTAGRLGLFD